jgi:hypothetical protein
VLRSLVRAAVSAAALLAATLTNALAQTSATPAPATVAQSTPSTDQATASLPTPNPLDLGGFFRSYYFTRQNATGYAGTNNGAQTNQASWNSAIDLHADYHFGGSGWFVGGSYFGAEPFDGPCSVAANHVKSAPNAAYGCVSQKPPNTNPDDTLPGFALSTFPEAYLGYKNGAVRAKLGDQLFTSPWAGPYDGTRIKPVAYQGADVAYASPAGVTVEAADILQWENRTSNNFQSSTLLTSFPAGNPGMASNIVFPGGNGKNTTGFVYGKIGYAPTSQPYSVNGYFYSVADLLNMWWFDGKYGFNGVAAKPYVALQGGVENNAGGSYIGKINSSVIGAQLGATAYNGRLGNLLVTAGFDYIPWQVDDDSSAFLASIAWKCNNTTFQVTPTTLNPATGKPFATQTLAYFLPVNAGQCFSNAATGTTSIYYGGWASPYTDAYATDPLFTTSITQGMADRRSPGTSWKLAGTYTSLNKKWTFIASMAWYNYGNALVSQTTNEWDLDGTYKFGKVGRGPYKGLMLRYRYGQRVQSNAFFASGSSWLGGLPLFKYNRAQLEYDF